MKFIIAALNRDRTAKPLHRPTDSNLASPIIEQRRRKLRKHRLETKKEIQGANEREMPFVI